MKIIIAGSRRMSPEQAGLIDEAVAASGFDVTEVVCGEAKGADTLGRKWAEARGISVSSHPAAWERLGKGAGPVRNHQMARYADGLIVFIWAGSRGSQNMLNQMIMLAKPYFAVYNGDMSQRRIYPLPSLTTGDNE